MHRIHAICLGLFDIRPKVDHILNHFYNEKPSLRPFWQSVNLTTDNTSRYRADSRFAPSQWETSLQSNAVSHWLGANLDTMYVLTALLLDCLVWTILSLKSYSKFYDVINGRHFTRYCPFVLGIHRSLVEPFTDLWCFFVVNLHKSLNKHSRRHGGHLTSP